MILIIKKVNASFTSFSNSDRIFKESLDSAGLYLGRSYFYPWFRRKIL